MDKRSGHTLVRFLRRHPLHFHAFLKAKNTPVCFADEDYTFFIR